MIHYCTLRYNLSEDRDDARLASRSMSPMGDDVQTDPCPWIILLRVLMSSGFTTFESTSAKSRTAISNEGLGRRELVVM